MYADSNMSAASYKWTTGFFLLSSSNQHICFTPTAEIVDDDSGDEMTAVT